MNIALAVKVDADPDTVRQRLIGSFDRPLSDRRSRPEITQWTVFGEVRGDEIRVETGGPFAGWIAWSGYGYGQPILRGHLRSATKGTVVEGTIRFRSTAWMVVLFVLVFSVGLVPPLLIVAGDAIGQGDYGRAVPPIILILGVVVLPVLGIAHDLRNGRREGYALRDRIVQGVTGGSEAENDNQVGSTRA